MSTDGEGHNPGRVEFIEHEIDVRAVNKARVIAFSDGSGSALVKGTPADGSLVRIQSACQYGDIYGSVECDCRDQLDHALETIESEPHGVLVHLLNQEGRSAGLVTKALAYRKMRDEGIDTMAAYRSFRADADDRNYGAGIQLLRDHLGLRSIRLLTNNPSKLTGLRAAGIEVTRVPIIKLRPGRCEAYFTSKLQNGHLDADDPAGD